MDDWAFPSNRILIAVFLVGAGTVLTFASLREPPSPLPQDTLDGTYVNPDCPEFLVRNGTIHFDDRTISGKVYRGKTHVILESDQALRYRVVDARCEFVVDDMGALNYAEGKRKVKIFSEDRKRAMYWHRQRDIDVERVSPPSRGGD